MRTRGGIAAWSRSFAVVLLATACSSRAAAHDEHNRGATSCDIAAGETCYYALIDDFHANPSTTDATGEIFLALNSQRTELRYSVEIDDLLNLKPNPPDRTEPNDIIGIHLHLNVPDTVGPHVLNIFGLATYNLPAEEDADLVVDYDHNSLTGIYDDGDATIDPATGQPYLPFFPLTSKPLSNWLDYLDAGSLMLAVHTNASGFPTMAIHGHISRVVPEPGTGVLLMAGLLFSWIELRRQRFIKSR